MVWIYQHPEQSRNVPHNKVDEVEQKIEEGDFQGARNKLLNDLLKHVQSWVLEDYETVSPLELKRIEVEDLIIELASRLA